jgi:hypothetical protein
MLNDSIQAQQGLVSFMAAWGSVVEANFESPSVPCPRLSKFLIKLDVIKFGGAVFELNDAIQVALYREGDVWYCEEERLAILAYGDTAEEAVHSFCEDFAVLWEEIALVSDDSLTPEAQEVKKNLLAAVKTARMG